jgi:hypothetical protein
METRDLASWAEFLNWLDETDLDHERLASSGTGVSHRLFRGQSDAGWSLETTLERRAGPGTSVVSYLALLENALPELESLTEKRWPEVRSRRVLKTLAEGWELSMVSSLPLELMAYLRHHGFPSPLLDWTRSPYVAAFFAYANFASKAERVAVYAYVEDVGQGKHWMGGEAILSEVGRNVRTDARHYRQQSQYTFCTARDESDNVSFVPHERAFDRGATDQDVLWKVSLPRDLRGEALAHLNRMNINAYTLFGTEEALLESMAVREFDRRKPRS